MNTLGPVSGYTLVQGTMVSPGFYLGMELVECRVCACSNNASLFSKVSTPICTPSSRV